MSLKSKARERPQRASDSADAPAQMAVGARPGLPLTLFADKAGRGRLDRLSMRDAAGAAEAARTATDDARERSGKKPKSGKESQSQTELKGDKDAKDGGAAGGAADTATDGQDGGAAKDAGNADADGDAAAPAQGDSPAAAPRAFRKVNAPALPPVLLPDMNAIRTPLVPPPPNRAQRRRETLLKQTGMTPESHHAGVQQGMNRVADLARSAQRQLVFQVGGIAASTRSEIERLAGRVPGIVGGAVARVIAANKTVRDAVAKDARDQIYLVASHIDVGRQDLSDSHVATNLDLQKMLMKEAPQVLKDAKLAMDQALITFSSLAAGKIATIPSGTPPEPIDNGMAKGKGKGGAKDKPPKKPKDGSKGKKDSAAKINPVTFDAAKSALSGELMADLGDGNRYPQYANLQCNASLDDLVPPHKKAYDKANKETRKNLTSPKNMARFFDTTMGLVQPLMTDETVDTHKYIGNLDENMKVQYMHLSSAKQRVIRQIDEKLTEVLTKKLNPEHNESLPFQTIKGLREAGEQIQQGLNDQARIVEASLKSNLAQLAQTYPDLVDRLMPMVESGEFLEAVSTLQRLAEAEGSIATLREGQIASVAEQAAQALAQSRVSFDQQVAGIHKAARKGIAGIQNFQGLAKHDFVRAALEYTGVVDDGVRSVFPQIIKHSTGLAERLLGPKTHKDQTLSNVGMAAVNYLNNVMAGEWGGYSARVNGLKKTLGGVRDDLNSGDPGTPFFSIRQGVRADTLARANQIVNALPPRPSTGSLVFGYLTNPVGTAIRHYKSDPDEDEVVKALSIPWPGPNAINQIHASMEAGNFFALTIKQLIEYRMDEDERGPVLKLFSASASDRSKGKQALINNSGWFNGIGENAVMALTQSFTSAEISAEIMSPADRLKLSESLQHTLGGPNEEIAAAYVNGQPDLALALRLRKHFDSMRGKSTAEQLQAGAEMERIIQAELGMSGKRGYVPQARLDRMRDAAFLRFASVTEAGRKPVGINVFAQPKPAKPGEAPLTAGQIPQPKPAPAPAGDGAGSTSAAPAKSDKPAAPTSTPKAPASEPSASSAPDASASKPTAPTTPAQPTTAKDQATAPKPEPKPKPPAKPAGDQADDDIEEKAKVSPELEKARKAVIDYMNRPYYKRDAKPGDRYLQQSVERRPEYAGRRRTYDPETGRYTLSPLQSVADYNRATILHGPNSVEARAAKAAATHSRIRPGSSLSTNQINALNESFSDNEFNAMRVRWKNASPRQRAAMKPQWEQAKKKHEKFLKLTAQGMGMRDGLDDPKLVQSFVQSKLGAKFARETSRSADIAKQIVGDGRIAIDTGMDLASGGSNDGTNEALIRNVLANRSQAELNENSHAKGMSMRQYARRLVNREIDGDDWQQADIDLMGVPENDLQRAAIAQRRYEHQRINGTGFIAKRTMSGQSETRWLDKSRDDMDARVVDAAKAGIAEAKRRGVDTSGIKMPENPRQPDGKWHPLVLRYAMDGDGRLRGDGPSMTQMASDVELTAGFYKEEIDRQEAFLTSLITVLAIVVSVALMFVPGVNLIAAGILTALVAGAATITVKAGMRGGRYGWEEMATDMASTAIEAATAGIGGALSKGATAAAKAAQAGRQVDKLGRIARVGAAMHNKFGKTLAPIAQEAITGGISSAATSALDDKLWDDGLGAGITKVAGHGLKGAAASAANAAVSGSITRRLEGRLAPDVADGEKMKKLNKIGKALGPNGREMITEIVANVGGSLSSEGINILADLATGKHKGGLAEAFKRLGKSGLQELVSSAGKTRAKQIQRRRFQGKVADIHAEGRDPTPAEARLLRWMGEIGGVVEQGTSTDEFSAQFSQTRARIAEMPPTLRAEMERMDPASAAKLIAVMDTGQLGTRAERRALVQDLAKVVPGLDADSFDRLLLRANEEHAPARRARKQQIKAARKQLLSGVRGPERAALAGLPVDDLAGLAPGELQRLAKLVADGDPSADLARIVADILPDDPGRRRRVTGQLKVAVQATSDARRAVRTRHARLRDEVMMSAPKEMRDAIGALRPRDLEALYRHLTNGSEPALARAEAVLRGADPSMDPGDARALARRMAESTEMASARFAHLDNVPPELRGTMSQLPDDALMELRVAQFTRAPLSEQRIEAILADVKKARPGADLDGLRQAIGKTMRHPHGRPGFREALTQKRALLDMVPFGMKRMVHRTPVLTLPESAFLSYVRGKGNENAVTLIVNGKPVILMRAGADPRVLAEEGIHVLQYHDPDFRDRIAGLEEGRMARWDELSVDQQIAAYRDKIDVEIDGQERLIARLERRAAGSLFPSARTQAMQELEIAYGTLERLKKSRVRAESIGPDTMDEIALGLAPRPSWLKRPARMFSLTANDANDADEALVKRHLPAARTPIRDQFFRLAKAGMSAEDKTRLLGLLRMLKGAMPLAELEQRLKLVGIPHPADAPPHLQGLRPDQIVDAIHDDLLLTSASDDTALAQRAKKIRRNLQPGGLIRKGTDTEKLVTATLKRLTSDEPGTAARNPQLETSKRVLLLALENQRSRLDILETLKLAASVLNSPFATDPITSLVGKPHIQATILEGLATNTKHVESVGSKVTHAEFFKGVRRMIESGVHDLSQAGRVQVFDFYMRAFYTGATEDFLAEFAGYVKTLRDNLPAASGTGPSSLDLMLGWLRVNMENHANRGHHLAAMRKTLALIEETVGAPPDSANVNKVTSQQIADYLRRAIADPEFRKSFVNIGSRAQDSAMQERDFEALKNLSALKLRRQASFSDRMRDPLTGDVPFVGSKEDLAQHLVTLTSTEKNPAKRLSEPEARAIAQRIEELEHSMLFAGRAGHQTSRDAVLKRFLAHPDLANLGVANTPDEVNRRGKKIEDAFREFVRDESSRVMREILEGQALPGIDGQPLTLSPTARIALVNILVRGRLNTDLVADLPQPVQRELRNARKALVVAYVQQFGGSIPPSELSKSYKKAYERLNLGILESSSSGSSKGSMLEHHVEGLMKLGNRDGQPELPEIYDEVNSATESSKRRYEAVDQEDSDADKSLDHIMKVEKQDDLPPGLEAGKLYGMDAKSGSQAFDPDQFKRYLVEMLRGLHQDGGTPESLFAEGGLAGLIYLTDSPKHMQKTREEVMKVLREVLAPENAGTDIVIKIGEDTHNITDLYDITPKLIADNVDRLNILFARIGQTGLKGTTDEQGQLGPFSFAIPGKSIQEEIRALMKQRLGSKKN